MGPTRILIQGAMAPFNLMYTNQFKCITQVKIRSFNLTVANKALIWPFYERNAITRDGFNKLHSARGPELI